MPESWIANRLPWTRFEERELLLRREWLVTNGLGGYASGSVSGACTRRHHGLLIAALQAPLGRQVMLTHLGEEVRVPGGEVFALYGEELAGGELELHSADVLQEFRAEAGMPHWTYRFGGVVLEKRVMLVHQQNTVHVTYTLLEAPGTVRLRLRPSMHFRSHQGRVDPKPAVYRVAAVGQHVEVQDLEGKVPPLRLRNCCRKAALVLDGGHHRELLYRIEAQRGYESRGPLFSPGYVRADLKRGESCTLVASTEPWEVIECLDPGEALEAELDRRRALVQQADVEHDPFATELVLAADQFLITPTGRLEAAARARASGDDVRTVIAGYHWFTDWGRDTMISLEGLTLCTNRCDEARWILKTFAHAVRDGLIPNLYPEGEREGLYHTADATLWFFHAVHRYLQATDDEHTLDRLLPVLDDIVDHHLRGTRFGIGVDPADGLLRQGAEGYQLTWMDAKVEDWVVTPRRGKAVEINALWYNALRLLSGWHRTRNPDRADVLQEHAARCRRAFHDRFWYADGGYLYDVVDGEDGDDPALRPNQIFAISLDHPVLDRSRWRPVIEAVRSELLTPVGLRSLCKDHPDYKRKYDGDLRARDAAYHQGTVWSWLIGPFVDAWLKLEPDDTTVVHELLEGFVPHLREEACIGQISEVFDAEAPYTSRGCVAQAWGVAEVLRCWLKTRGGG